MSSKCGLLVLLLVATVALLLQLQFIESGYVKATGGTKLNEYISHYETLSYDTDPVHASHSRTRRSVVRDPHVYLKFRAHGRPFHLRLRRDLSTFADNLVVDSPRGIIAADTSHIYSGEVLGEHGSHVFGSIIDGVFTGKIHTDRDAYYVEHAKYYFPNGTHLDHGFHSVIYNENHVDDPYAKHRTGHHSGCGINADIKQWMESVQNSAETTPPPPPPPAPAKHQPKPQAAPLKAAVPIDTDHEFRHPHEKYSAAANHRSVEDELIGDSDSWHATAHERVRRAPTQRSKEENKNTCSLYIQTDPLIWRHIREGIADHDRGKSSDIDEKTREEILSLIAHHVTAVNYIYRNTKFDGRVEHRNIRFEVQRIKIDDDSACKESHNGDPNPFCMENIDVSNFLNLHSLGNHEIFCLAYVFTYRDFTGGTLGLAWVASASGASGGICEKYKTYTETVGGLYQSTKRSLNTGIITFVNYNSRVPPKVSQLTLAHEIGHNFGSPHDFPQDCRPGGLSGNYIMFASATSGDRPNNSKFSTCSIRNISNVLDAIEDSKKRNCFLATKGAFCGNKIVEEGEECDCGYDDGECQDKCCYPRVVNEADLSANSSAKGCTRRARTQCSPSQGPCCQSETCSFVPAAAASKCREATECSWSSTCNGTTPECPEPKPRQDKTKCNNGTQLCISGECAGSICLLWDMQECFLTSHLIPNINKRKLCELACQRGNDSASCRSTSEFGLQVGLPREGISLRPGSPCDNFQGYCDVFLRCRAVDAEGPLVRLKNLLFNPQTLQTLAQWVTENWYIVVLMGIGFVIVMGMFIKCCAVHTPSSNPKKPPARRIGDTLRRPMHTLRRMRNHHHGGGGGGGGGHRGAGPRSIPPPHEERGGGGGGGRSRSAGDRNGGGRDYGRGGGGGGGGGGRDAHGRDDDYHHQQQLQQSHPGRGDRGDRGGRHGDGGGGGGGRRSSSQQSSGRPGGSGGGGGGGGGSRGPTHHGYGEGRGQQHYPPKAIGPPANYSRPPIANNSHHPHQSHPANAHQLQPPPQQLHQQQHQPPQQPHSGHPHLNINNNNSIAEQHHGGAFRPDAYQHQHQQLPPDIRALLPMLIPGPAPPAAGQIAPLLASAPPACAALVGGTIYEMPPAPPSASSRQLQAAMAQHKV